MAAGIALANLLSMLLVLGLLASVPDSAHSALRWLQALGGLYFLWLAGQALLAQRRLEMPAQRDVPSRGGYLRGLRDGCWRAARIPSCRSSMRGCSACWRASACRAGRWPRAWRG